jgi:hypothetical protein
MAYWIQQYLLHGTQPPTMPREIRDSSGNVVRDANGLTEGGVRQPFIQVPVALNRASGDQGVTAGHNKGGSAQDCPLYGLYRAWSATKIKSMYRTHHDYVKQVAAAAHSDVAAGWLLPQDAADAVAKARAFTGPWDEGTCYDTYNANGNETGPASSALATESYDPNLPLGGETALREANCNVVVPAGG